MFDFCSLIHSAIHMVFGVVVFLICFFTTSLSYC